MPNDKDQGREPERHPPKPREDEDIHGGSRVRRAELSPDDFDVDNERERGEPHLHDE